MGLSDLVFLLLGLKMYLPEYLVIIKTVNRNIFQFHFRKMKENQGQFWPVKRYGKALPMNLNQFHRNQLL